MDKTLDKLLTQLENYAYLDEQERKSVQQKLLEFAGHYPDKFIEKIREIEPNEESVLFEVYETLANQPEKWVDFIVSEFDRIEQSTKHAKNKFKYSFSFPLYALVFFVRQEFPNKDKLVERIKKGIDSDYKHIIQVSMELLADLYMSDKKKYAGCKQIIEEQTKSKYLRIRKSAKEILADIQ